MNQFDIFLKMDGIEGESQDLKHKGEMQVLTLLKEVKSADVRGPGATSTWNDAVFTMRIDKSAPKLMLACASGEKFPKALVTMRKAGRGQQEFLKITFSDAIVSRFRMRGANEENTLPYVEFALNFAQVEEEYRAQKEDGSLSGAMKYSFSVSAGRGQ